MALMITSKQVRQRAASLTSPKGVGVPAAVASGAAMGTHLLISHMKKGRTIAGLTAISVGSTMALVGKSTFVQSAGIGLSAGGLWSLLMRLG